MNVEWEIAPELVQTFDVWTHRPGVKKLSVEEILPGAAVLTAEGSRRALRSLAREIWDGDTLQERYLEIEGDGA